MQNLVKFSKATRRLLSPMYSSFLRRHTFVVNDSKHQEMFKEFLRLPGSETSRVNIDTMDHMRLVQHYTGRRYFNTIAMYTLGEPFVAVVSAYIVGGDKEFCELIVFGLSPFYISTRYWWLSDTVWKYKQNHDTIRAFMKLRQVKK